MEYTTELAAALKELEQLTGVRMDISVHTLREAEAALDSVRCLCTAYREKYNKNYFLKNLMTGKLSAGEIHEQARRFHIASDGRRVLFLLEVRMALDDAVMEILKHLFPAQTKTFLVPIEERRLAVIRPLRASETEEDILQIAHTIVDTLNMEALASVRASYSGEIKSLEELPDAYREAGLALKVGSLFYSEQMIFPYNRLGVGRLICQLPVPLCESFLEEIFGEEAEFLDKETISAVDRFFQNNLNIAETARQLHMHRNTLIYRLDLLQKRTGLDLRKFEDAMTFKIASMIMNYLERSR